MAGRPRKPKHLKLVTGTFRPHRENPLAPQADPILLTAPDWLPGPAKAIFADLATLLFDMRATAIGDRDALAMLALRSHEVRVCTGIIEDLGRTYTTTNAAGERLHKRRPEVAMRADAMRHTLTLLNEFGLTPAARSKVSVLAKPAINPFADLNRP